MRVAIRVDSSFEIGTGHVMRCLALACQLRNNGAEVEFVCRAHDGNIISSIESNGFTVHPLALLDGAHNPVDKITPYSSWVGATDKQDVSQTISVLKMQSAEPLDWMVVDHYGLDAEWERQLRSVTSNIMVIDDLANRSHDCDLLLDQNLFTKPESRYQALLPDHCTLCLGPKYAILRPEFAQLRNRLNPKSGELNNLLVYFGGIDKTGETLKTLDAVNSLTNKGIQVDVVAGVNNPRRSEIANRCQASGYTFHSPAQSIAELMSYADLAIGAGGTTSWERCCLGLPTLMISIADNQVEIARELDRAGAARFLGVSNEVTVEHIVQAIIHLQSNGSELQSMSRRAMQLVDGHGATRLIETMTAMVNKEVSV